jgi:hypothetical protein
VLFAGAASPNEQGASIVVLRLAQTTPIQALTTEQVVAEEKRNLTEKLPQTLPTFRLLASRYLQVVPDPLPEELLPSGGAADPEDLPILVTAVREGCYWLFAFNTRHDQPGHPDPMALAPGEFLLRVRDLLTQLRP